MKTEKGQAMTPSALTGMRAAIHHYLTCAPLSQNINISQDSKFMSANKMLTGLNWMLIYSDMNDILYVYVVVNFLFQLIFIFPLFWGMVMYANEFKTKEKQKLTEIKN